MDYISREDALKWCRPEEWGTPDERWRPESEFGKMIKALPPQGPKRGKWVVDGLDHRGGIDWMHCSVCGCRRVNVPMDHTPYCPYCGAKMEDGE